MPKTQEGLADTNTYLGKSVSRVKMRYWDITQLSHQCTSKAFTLKKKKDQILKIQKAFCQLEQGQSKQLNRINGVMGAISELGVFEEQKQLLF